MNDLTLEEARKRIDDAHAKLMAVRDDMAALANDPSNVVPDELNDEIQRVSDHVHQSIMLVVQMKEGIYVL